MEIQSIITSLGILVFSVILHELAHGVVAEKLGDSTARYAGRLTLNPLPHLDPFGSVLLPLFMWFATAGQFVIGAAKPVPVNFFNLRNPKRDMALVSLAGPGTNFLLALILGLPIRLGLLEAGEPGFAILLQASLLNIGLGIFNMLPIPPLDGSKVFASLFSNEFMYKILSLERFGFLLILLFLYLGVINAILLPLLNFFAKFFLGIAIF